MALEEDLERGLVAIREELLQQLTIPKSSHGPHAKQRLHVAAGSLQGISSGERDFITPSNCHRVLPYRGSIDPEFSLRLCDFDKRRRSLAATKIECYEEAPAAKSVLSMN
jgi:hypothetical protein